MATDPFDSLRVRLTNHVTRRRSLGALGLLGTANVAWPSETTARKKRKRKNKQKNKNGQTTTPAPTTPSTPSTTTTRAPGTCGAAGSNCGTAATPCICAGSPIDLENVRCISLAGFTLGECLADSDCTGGKVCIIDANQENSACATLCTL